MANYADGLTDLPLPKMIEHFRQHDKIASLVSVKPARSLHVVSLGGNGIVKGIQDLTNSGLFVNGGYFLFKREIFDYINEGDELVEQPFQRLIAKGQLISYPCDGFWAAMDTFKEKQQLEDLYSRGEAPWEIWKSETHGNGKGSAATMAQLPARSRS